MAETGPGGQDVDFSAPETESRPDYSASPQEQEIVLRNADTYLYELHQNTQEAPNSPFKQGLLERIQQRIERFRVGTEARHLTGPLLDAFATASDEKRWDEFMKGQREAEDSEQKQNRLQQERLTRVLVFRKAHELRQKTIGLLVEKETATPERSAAIDQELNNRYWEVMALAHSRSYRIEKETGQGDKKKFKDYRLEVDPEVVSGQADDLDALLPNQEAQHRGWIENRIRGEANDPRLERGFEKPFVTRGELTPENFKETEIMGEELANTLDFLAGRSRAERDWLKTHFGIDIDIEDAKNLKPIPLKGKDKKSLDPIPRRTAKIRFQNGETAALTISLGGFIDKKGEKITVQPQPSSADQPRYMKVHLKTTHRRSNAEQTPYSKELDGPTIEQMNESQEFQHVIQALLEVEGRFVASDVTHSLGEASDFITSLENQINHYQMEVSDYDRQVDAYHDNLKNQPRWQTLTDIEKMAALQKIPGNLRREIELRNSAIKSVRDNQEKIARHVRLLSDAQLAGDIKKARQQVAIIEKIIKPEPS